MPIGAGDRTATSRNAATGSAFPFSVERLDRLGIDRVPDEAKGAARRSGSPRARAACSRRAATFTASPVTSGLGLDRPATTSPVLTPIRVREPTPWSRSSSLFRPSSASRISAAARTARSASSSWTCGIPKTAIDRVADELLDRAAVALDRGPHRLEVATP